VYLTDYEFEFQLWKIAVTDTVTECVSHPLSNFYTTQHLALYADIMNTPDVIVVSLLASWISCSVAFLYIYLFLLLSLNAELVLPYIWDLVVGPSL